MTRQDLSQYIEYLDSYYSEKNKKPLAESTKAGLFFTVKDLFTCLYVNSLILVNPSEKIKYKKRDSGKTRAMLCQKEMDTLLNSIKGTRDRAMFELMYSSGLRAGEIARLKIGDIDLVERMVMIRESKFRKDRIEPISSLSLLMLKKYLKTRLDIKENYVFPGLYGIMNTGTINTRFKKYAKKNGLYKKNLCAHSTISPCPFLTIPLPFKFILLASLSSSQPITKSSAYLTIKQAPFILGFTVMANQSSNT